ncbi:MAG: PQQ-binding-like beta-propeller repeat protein [candidate division Zixibacteria bacterium]|nr:PQQ-binding-like beta-propeller repeat protein [candidate division Zixibacteria bacterium]
MFASKKTANLPGVILFLAVFALIISFSGLYADDMALWPAEPMTSDYSSTPLWTTGSDRPMANIAVADLNGDNTPDIIGGEYQSDSYSDSSKVYALDGMTGDTLWTFWFQDGVKSLISGDINLDGVPDIIGGGAYGTDIQVDGRVRAIDGVTGTEIWNFGTGASVNDLAIGDFNNSGNLDVACCGFDDYVYAIDGSTGDYIWRKYLGSIFVNAVAVGDVNEDGIDDVGYTHEYLTGYDNYLGVVDGVDGSEIWEETVPYYGSDMLIDDIDDDGFLEVVFGLHFDDDHGEIQVRDGLTGTTEWTYDFGAMDHTNGAFYLNSVDIDDDKDKDLIVGNYLAQRKLYIFDGDVNTPMVISPELTRYVYNTAVGDVDNDGYLDIVAASYDRVQIINATTGNPMWYFGVSGRIYDVKCADFDGDLWIDIAAGGGASYNPTPEQTIWALKTIQTPLLWEYDFGEYGNALTVVDLNQDDHADVITAVSVGDKATAIDGKTGDVMLWSWTGTENLYAITHGDYDNDGDYDIAVGGADDMVTALDGLSGDILWQFTTPTDQIYRSCLVSADLNGDGADDVIAGTDDSHVYAIDGTTGLEIWNYPAGADLEEVAVAQMNGSGPVDVVCGLTGGTNGSKVVVVDGSDGSFMWEYVCVNKVEYVEVFDVNNDDVPDVAAGVSFNPNTLYMIDGFTHDTLWTASVDINSNAYGLAHGDINGDNNPDVIVGGSSSSSVHAYDGLTGALIWSFPIGDEVQSVLGYDVDGDGDDEAIAGGDDNKLYVIDNDGSELFSYNCADAVKHIQVGDISANTEPNIACLTFGSSGVAYAFKSLIPEPNVPPYAPASPDPEDKATGVALTASLSWMGGDPNTNDQVHYDVYFGTTDPPPLVSDDQLAQVYDPPTDFEYGTEYFWQIIAFDEADESTAGPVWTFTTEYDVICGDCNNDLSVNVSDAVIVINYVFIGGTAPVPLCVGDANADGSVNVSDAVLIINYVFIGGNPPDPNCCGK